MTWLALALLAQVQVYDQLGHPSASVTVSMRIVSSSELALEMTPMLGGGAWLVADYREDGRRYRVSSWVPAHGARLAAVAGLALDVSEVAPVLVARAD